MAANASGAASRTTCLSSGPVSLAFVTLVSAKVVVLLPLCVFTLALGLQRWRARRASPSSSSSSSSSTSSDCFTYHMVTMQMSGASSFALWASGARSNNTTMVLVGLHLFVFTWFGEMLFHMVTCVERYLAVVHPLTYRRLKSRRGTSVRSGGVAAVWLTCLAGLTLVQVDTLLLLVLELVVLSACLAVVSVCSLAVLRVLLRPGPGQRGGARERADQSKRRAFYTMSLILAVLLVWFCGNLLWFVTLLSEGEASCEVMAFQVLFTMPSSLAPPLLFLHRQGKLACCRRLRHRLAVSGPHLVR